jgi:multidrug efflux pump subunit AcrA (membrane-fusion protein)
VEEKKNIELRSEEVEDILGKVPGWVTRNGILMLFFIVILLLLGSWVFKIPDVKKAEIYVTTMLPAADIESRSDGKIEKLLTEDNEHVAEKQVLAVIENPADYEDVQLLKAQLQNFSLYTGRLPELKLQINGKANLGMIQPDYAAFYKNYRDYREFLLLDYHQQKIELLEQEHEQYIIYSANLDTRASILEEEYELARNQFVRDSTLFMQGVVSESDFETTKSKLLSFRAGWQAMISLKTENDIKMAGIREQILELQLKRQEQLTNLTTSVEEALNRVKASLAIWEKQYLIVAPIEGQVTFNRIWSVNQNVKAGEKVMTIIPSEQGEYIGKIRLPVAGAGKVKEGHQVNIRFENFPYLEFGMVKGEVSNVSKVPQDDYYTVEVVLPDGLMTYYGVEIGFSQNMQGQAEILTDKMRLLQRVFNPVKSAVSRQREM